MLLGSDGGAGCSSSAPRASIRTDTDTWRTLVLDHAVVGLDHSPADGSLVAGLATLTRLGVQRVTLVTVLGGFYPQAPEERHRDHYRARGEELATDLAETGLDVDVEVRSGRPAEELRRAADERDADLIVAGSRGHTPWRDLFLGSTVLDLLRTAGRPVLLLPLGPTTAIGGGGLVLATDGSTSARDAERVAVTLGGRLGGVAVTVLDDRADEDAERDAADHLAAVVAGSGLTAEVIRGPLPEAIAQLATDRSADVVVVGARGRNPLTGLLLGSTAEHLLRTTERPVLLVRSSP
jgi:nucleotide-binding universal stress UspA family protein